MNSKPLPTIGSLYIVSTPIGNLKDMTFRAVEILKSVKWIAAEDTRHSMHLLQHYGIKTPLKSFHTFNEQQRSQHIFAELDQGHDIALISDAGTPLISDPGYVLIQQLAEKNYRIIPIPGCCAAIAALSAAGLATDRFNFVGFLPAKKNNRCAQLSFLKTNIATQIFYEAPHRLLECLEDMLGAFGANRFAVVARELTKSYESFQRGTLAELSEYYRSHIDEVRGEIVILVAGAAEVSASIAEAERLLKILLQELPVKKAAAIAAEITGLRKNELYALAIEMGS